MAASNTGLNEPLLSPAYPVTHDDRGAYVFLTAVIMIVLSGIAVVFKIQVTVSTFRRLRQDDIALLTALCFALGHTIAICRAVHHGLGRSRSILTNLQMQQLSEHYYAANILLWPSIAASKSAVAFLILALQPPRRWLRVVCYTIIGVSATWALAAVFTMAFQCGPTRYVLGPTGTNICIDQFSAQVGIRLVDIAIDVALIMLPVRMMNYVQTDRGRKLMVSAMFGTRIITPVFTAISLSTLRPFYAHPVPTRPFTAVVPSIWTIIALNASLLTACLPSIKRILGGLAAGFSNANILEPFELQHSSHHGASSGRGGLTNAMRPQKRSKVEHSNVGTDEDHSNYAYYLREEGRVDSGGSDDAESKRGLTDGIIMQTVDYSVEFEGERDGSRR